MEESVLLFVAIFEISHIPQSFKDKSIKFEMHMGNTMQDVQEESGDYRKMNNVIDLDLTSNDGLYLYSDFDEIYPCLNIISVWPDFRRRLYLTNTIAKVADAIVKIHFKKQNALT